MVPGRWILEKVAFLMTDLKLLGIGARVMRKHVNE